MGKMNKAVYNTSQKQVGYVNDKLEYCTVRDYAKGQIFVHPKYRNAIGLSVQIIEQLNSYHVRTFRPTIVNFEKEVFDAVIDFRDFCEKSKPFFAKGRKNSDRQKILSLDYFQRVYPGQGVLE